MTDYLSLIVFGIVLVIAFASYYIRGQRWKRVAQRNGLSPIQVFPRIVLENAQWQVKVSQYKSTYTLVFSRISTLPPFKAKKRVFRSRKSIIDSIDIDTADQKIVAAIRENKQTIERYRLRVDCNGSTITYTCSQSSLFSLHLSFFDTVFSEVQELHQRLHRRP